MSWGAKEVLQMAEIKITLKGFKCERYKHEWIPRNKEDIPIICPKCKSPYWNKPKKPKKINTAQTQD